MITHPRKHALVETVLLLAGDRPPTERHYKAAAAAHGCSPRTARRTVSTMLELPASFDAGLSARAALDSMVDLDPRVVYASEPSGPGWWPDMTVLEALAAHPTLATAHDALARAGRIVPSYSQFCRRLKLCLTPAYFAGISRGGGARATAELEVFIKRARTPRMHVVELDAFELPIDVLVPRAEKPRKPWLLLAIDRGTRAVPAWLLVPGRPTAADSRTLLALMAVGAPCPDGTVIGGLPHFVMPDNGGEFSGWEFTRALTELGIAQLAVPPSTPHLKGTVERMGQHIQQRLIDTLPGATHGPELRHGESPWRDADLMAVNELEARVDEWLTSYNTTHRHAALRGRTPLQAWLADPEPVRYHSDSVVLRELMPRVSRTVSKKGVLLDYRHYLHPVLGASIGDDVQVGWLPRHTDRVEVFTADGTWICTALDASDLSEPEVDEVMTGRLRRGRAVTAASRASVDLRARLAELDAPTGPLPLSVTDYRDSVAPTLPDDERPTTATVAGDSLFDIVFGDES